MHLCKYNPSANFVADLLDHPVISNARLIRNKDIIALFTKNENKYISNKISIIVFCSFELLRLITEHSNYLISFF